jgi:rod shape-determining protein MreD
VIYYASVPLTLVVVVLQLAAAPSFSYLGVHPDLLVVWLACWAALRGTQEVLVLVAVAGCGLGLLGREPFGASLLALLPIAALAWLREQRGTKPSVLVAVLGALVAGVVYNLLQAAAAFAGGDPFGTPLDVVRVAPRAAVLDALIAAIWYWPLRLIFGRIGRRQAGQFR